VAPLIAVVLYHFAARYTLTQIKRWVLPLLYSVCFLFIFLVPTDLVHKGMQLKPYGYAPIFGPFFPVIIIFSIIITLMALRVFVKSYRALPNAEHKNRIAYIILGVIFMFFGGIFDILPTFGLPLYPGFIIGNIVFCLLTTVAIVKHNLLDIHVVLRKGTAYVLASAVLAIPFIVIFLLTTRVFTEVDFPLWVYFVVAITLALILPQLWQWVQRWVDRWYYRDRYDYLQALETFSRQTQSLIDSARLGSTMVNLLAKALRSSNVYLLQPLSRSSDFTTASTNGANNPTPVTHLKNGSALVNWLKRSNSMLSYEDIEIIPQLQATTLREMETLKRIGAELISPLKAPTGQLSGILILGKKRSEQPYTSEDKQLIYTICNHLSTNLENVRLYGVSQQELEERKQAEEEIRVSEERYRHLFENLNDAALLADTETGQILETNRQGKVLLGRSRNEIVGMYQSALHPPDKTEEYKQRFAAHVAKGHAADYEGEIIRKDGTIIPVYISASPLTIHGRHLILVLFHDITERKEAEEKEKELQRELYRSSRLASVGELAAGVAHQINNPLTGVLGFSQRLLRKSTDQEVSQDLRTIYTEAERATKIVQNLLTFARRRQPNKQYSDINEILQSALELRAYELKTSNIEVITDLAPSLHQIMIDFHQIQEVFLNIMLNAEQVMTEANSGGRLTIKTEERKGYIRTTFTDDGPGIPAEHLDRIFDPFFSTREKKGGTGLGLSVCHGIITEHGGRVYARSKPGKGATFFVELPITSKTANKRLIDNE
jgi:PAS domain S-box-containing protein